MANQRTQKAEARVPFNVPIDPYHKEKRMLVIINGMRYDMARGETVMVPQAVVDCVRDSDRQTMAALGLQEKYEKIPELSEEV